MYRHLDSEKIVVALDLLSRRVRERFPQAGLTKVVEELYKTGQEAQERSLWVARPLWHFRILIGALLVLIMASFVPVAGTLKLINHPLTLGEFIQVLESGINDVVFFGIGIFFLATLETRIKRKRVLALLHELRALAHVIDMHQLTKDPESLLRTHQKTKSSPQRTMTEFELQRYLNYCGEMLAMISKIASVYVRHFPDTEVVDVVNDIESLTHGLSRNIWQKIMLLQSLSKGLAGLDSRTF